MTDEEWFEAREDLKQENVRLRAELAAEREQKFRHMNTSTKLCNELAAEREESTNLRMAASHFMLERNKLREALEPFAEIADTEGLEDARDSDWFKATIIVGDLRRARAVLKETKP